MSRIILYFTFIVCLFGCHTVDLTTKHNPSDNVIKINDASVIDAPLPKPITSRTDLPLGWREISGDDWSYGLPMDYYPIDNTIAKYKSFSENLTVSFDMTANVKTDIYQFIIVGAITTAANNGAEIIAQKEKTVNGITTVALQLLYSKLDGVRASSLEFFQLHGNKVYHLSCWSETVNNLKSHIATCFSVVETLKISGSLP